MRREVMGGLEICASEVGGQVSRGGGVLFACDSACCYVPLAEVY